LCRFWGVSRQAFYKDKLLIDQQKNKSDLILSCVKDIRKRHTKMGTLKLRKELQCEIEKCGRGYGRNKFFDLLRTNDLLLKRRRRYSITTNSNHPFYKHTNQLANVEITRPDQAWVSDITYLQTREKFVYLSLVTDVYSRKIVGWNVDESLAVEGAMEAIKMAICNCSGTRGLIHHSDRGIQYCCHAYNELTERKGIKMSMGEAGNCYDNAIAERVNGILKGEYLLDSEFVDKKHAVNAVKEAVYLYNYERPHWSLGLKKPADVYINGKTEQKEKRAV
jgi:putative transposase